MFWGGILVAIASLFYLRNYRSTSLQAHGGDCSGWLVVMGLPSESTRPSREFNSTTTTESTPVLFLMVDTLRADTLYGADSTSC